MQLTAGKTIFTAPAAVLLAILVGCSDSGVDVPATDAWTQLGPGGVIELRATTSHDTCPNALVDGSPMSMVLRAHPAEGFPDSVCSVTLPADANAVEIDGIAYPVLSPDVKKIAVIGDAGCRMKGDTFQACNDPDAWPFAKIADRVAAATPDLIIHVGDMVYRHTPCKEGMGCDGSPYGDNAATWSADWFEPARPLTQTAPFIYVRGNHENCHHAGAGWFRYQAPGAHVDGPCVEATAPWTVDVAGVNLVVLDVATGSGEAFDPQYASGMPDLIEPSVGERWLVMHRPFWARYNPDYQISETGYVAGDPAIHETFGGLVDPNVSMILSGHTHSFQLLDLRDGPVQIISGNGGSKLDPAPDTTARDLVQDDVTMDMAISDTGFGYVILERPDEGGWHLTAYDAQGRVRHACRIHGATADCGR